MSSEEACLGTGPTAPASMYGIVQFIVIIITVVFMLVSSVVTLYMRRYRRRLRVRSLLPIVMGSVGGMVIMLIRGVYDLIGIEYFPCALLVTMFYMFPVVIVSSDLISIMSFMAKQYKRQALNANTLQALHIVFQQKQQQLKGDEDVQNSRASLKEYFRGLWNFLLDLIQVGSFFGRIDAKYYFHTSSMRMSLGRELSYEFIAAMFFTSPYLATMLARMFTVPAYRPESGCTGCILESTDAILTCVMTAICGIPISLLIVRAQVKKIPDPLFYMYDLVTATSIMMPMLIATMTLFLTDPDGLMKAQKVDWYLFDMMAIVYIHCLRTVVQLARTRKIHKQGEANVRLLDLLSDAKGAILFEKHLIAELANENLLFWREGVKYKQMFDRSDFELSQQSAKIMYRTFIAPNAMLPINIGSDIKRGLDARFKGAVGRNVFDEALVEVYLMMQNGAFRRFVKSAAFKEYAETRADFSLSNVGVFNPMSVLPDDSTRLHSNGGAAPGSSHQSVADTEVGKTHLNVKEYIQSL